MFNAKQVEQIKKILSKPQNEIDKILNPSILKVIEKGNEIFVAVIGNTKEQGHGRTCFMNAQNFISIIALQIYRMSFNGAFTEEEALIGLKKGIEFYKAQDKEPNKGIDYLT